MSAAMQEGEGEYAGLVSTCNDPVCPHIPDRISGRGLDVPKMTAKMDFSSARLCAPVNSEEQPCHSPTSKFVRPRPSRSR